jgi:hypothetical protein
MYGSINTISQTIQANSGGQLLELKAARLFMLERRRARIHCLLAKITGRSMRMLDLNEVRQRNDERSRSYLGSRAVAIDRIRGSENRCDDFDSNLRPLSEHNRQRWLNIAVARLSGTTLPPVELIHVGGFYFVRDGHHRISVARALGERYVDAVVLGG